MGDYDVSLVVASFVVAVLAAYTAVYFGLRLGRSKGGERWRWLVLGGLAMGSGIWTMHFVGMRAMDMGVEMSFDGTMTAVSWLAAVLASCLALQIISRPSVNRSLFVMATLVMAGGIVVMHYLGMYAMRMSVPPEFHALWLGVSVAIAVIASGGALALCRILARMEGAPSPLIRLGAALTMAVAICGMHYTGMLAMTFPGDAVPSPDNGLRGDWMGIPLAVFCVALLAVALFVAVYDLQERRERILKQQQENERVARKAFVDPVTGLPNRSGLEQRLLDALASEDARRHPFALVHLDVANFRALANRLGPESLDDVIREVAGAIGDLLPETVYLARYSNSGFFLLVPDYQESGHQFLFRQLRELDQRIGTSAVPLLWRAGQSVFPVTGNSSRKLIRAAMVPRDLSEIGRFENVKADPEMVLPGNKAVS